MDPFTAAMTGASALASLYGQRETNATNAAIADMNSWRNRQEARRNRQFQNRQANRSRRFNKREAQKARDFTEFMSSTSYQRAADDLEAAGLNRILAMSDGAPMGPSAAAASSAPQGSMGTAVQPPPMINPMSSAMDAAMGS